MEEEFFGPQRPSKIRPWLLVVFIGVILIAVGFFGWYFFTKNKTTNSSETNNTPKTITTIPTDNNPMTNWKTYMNAKYGFFIKYPESYKYKENDNVQEVEDASEITRISFTDVTGGVLVSITVNDKTANLIPNTMNTIEAQKIAKDAIIDGKAGQNFDDMAYGVKTENYVYRIYTENQTLKAIIKSMISTFRFTTPTVIPAPEWKTFQGKQVYYEQLNYSFNYPADFSVQETKETNGPTYLLLDKTGQKILGLDYIGGSIDDMTLDFQDETLTFGSNKMMVKTFFAAGQVSFKFYNFINSFNAQQYKFDTDTNKLVEQILATFQFK